MRGGGHITRSKPVASARSLSTVGTITSWGYGLTSAIPPPLLQHVAGLTRVECWMIVAHFQTGGDVERRDNINRSAREHPSFQPRVRENMRVLKPTLSENEATLIENSPKTSGWTHVT